MEFQQDFKPRITYIIIIGHSEQPHKHKEFLLFRYLTSDLLVAQTGQQMHSMRLCLARRRSMWTNVSSLTQTKSIKNHLALFSPRDDPKTRRDDGNKMVVAAAVSTGQRLCSHQDWMDQRTEEVSPLCENNPEHIVELKLGLIDRREMFYVIAVAH